MSVLAGIRLAPIHWVIWPGSRAATEVPLSGREELFSRGRRDRGPRLWVDESASLNGSMQQPPAIREN